MMLEELSALLSSSPAACSRAEHLCLIEEENALGKATTSNRKLTGKHLVDLYGLDASITLFRILVRFWPISEKSRPLLATLCATARDPLLRMTWSLVQKTPEGGVLTSAEFVNAIEEAAPGRFSPAMKLSLAQNTASSWAQAGFLLGRQKKIRTRPIATAESAAYALAIAYLCGFRGQLLFENYWTSLLDQPIEQLKTLAKEASKRGYLDYRGIGSIIEVSFPQLLTPKEIEGSTHGTR
jgi:hypothetical protein